MIQVRVMDKNGLHARPASKVVSIALAHSGVVYLERNGVRCNAKKIMEVMGLNLIYGDEVKVVARGKGGEEVEELIKNTIISFE
nr:HPr family phosphocarrier protein [uncultured Caproiciproducens sp.]